MITIEREFDIGDKVFIKKELKRKILIGEEYAADEVVGIEITKDGIKYVTSNIRCTVAYTSDGLVRAGESAKQFLLKEYTDMLCKIASLDLTERIIL